MVQNGPAQITGEPKGQALDDAVGHQRGLNVVLIAVVQRLKQSSQLSALSCQ